MWTLQLVDRKAEAWEQATWGACGDVVASMQQLELDLHAHRSAMQQTAAPNSDAGPCALSPASSGCEHAHAHIMLKGTKASTATHGATAHGATTYHASAHGFQSVGLLWSSSSPSLGSSPTAPAAKPGQQASSAGVTYSESLACERNSTASVASSVDFYLPPVPGVSPPGSQLYLAPSKAQGSSSGGQDHQAAPRQRRPVQARHDMSDSESESGGEDGGDHVLSQLGPREDWFRGTLRERASAFVRLGDQSLLPRLGPLEKRVHMTLNPMWEGEL